jgi:hypothetical protein
MSWGETFAVAWRRLDDVPVDTATIQRQLGIAHDPLTPKGRLATVLNHPVTIAGALLRRARRS